MTNTGRRDQLTTKIVVEHIAAHDKRVIAERESLGEIRAAYMTDYWRWVNGMNGEDAANAIRNSNQIEVNTIWPMLTGYRASLYPRAVRPVVSPDASRRGSAPKGQLVLGQMMTGYRMHSRVMAGLSQALLYPSSAAKVGYRSGYGSPLERVYLRIVPHWDVLLDHDVLDAEDERFRGHFVYLPISEVEEKYGLKNLEGTERIDFLSGTTSKSGDSRGSDSKAPSDNKAFVRVLELCNLVDMWEDPKRPGVVTKGRLEIWVLGQGDRSMKPVFTGALPFARVNGTPLPNIAPLIFNPVPEHPLQGIPHAKRMMPQVREKNGYRSYFAAASRKDARIYLVRKGYFTPEQVSAIERGDDSIILQVEKEEGRPLEDIIVAVRPAPISSNIKDYMALTDQDLSSLDTRGPNARGQITQATALEVQTVWQNTESEYGMHAEIKDHWLSTIGSLLLRAVQAAMYDSGESDGAFDTVDAEYGPVGASAEPARSKAEDAKAGKVQSAAAIDAIKIGQQRPLVDTPASGPRATGVKKAGEEEEGAKHEQDGGEEEAKHEQDEEEAEAGEEEDTSDSASAPPLTPSPAPAREPAVLVLEENGELIEITVEDLEGDFQISFNEGGKSPMAMERVQTALIKLRADLTELWGGVQKKDPFSIAYMRNICEAFDLPKDLHPDALIRAMGEQAAEKPKRPKGAPPPGGQPPGPPGQPPGQPPGPPGQPAAPEAGLQATLAKVAQMPPEQAIPMLLDIFQGNPDLEGAIQQIASLPPEQQQQAIQAFLQQAAAAIG